MEKIESQQEVALTMVEIAAVGDLDVPLVATAVLGDAAAGAERESVEITTGDGIDDTAGGIGAVAAKLAGWIVITPK